MKLRRALLLTRLWPAAVLITSLLHANYPLASQPLLIVGPADKVRQGAAVSMPVSFSDVLALPDEGIEPQGLAYGVAPQQTVLRFDPETGPAQPLLLIHGGCWSNAYDRNHTRPLARALVAEGYTVWLPEYRRVGDAGGGWPGTFEDIRTVINFVADNAGQAPVVVGHSAGGHLALRAAAEPSLPIQYVVGLAAISDLVAYGEQEGSCQQMVPKLLQAYRDEVPGVYADATVKGKPLHVGVSLIGGSADPIVGAEQLEDIPGATTAIVPGAGHFDLIHPGTPAFAVLLTAIQRGFSQ